MILLIFVTIYIYRKFNTLAALKNYTNRKWGIKGSAMYLGVSFGSQFLFGFLILDIRLDETTFNIYNLVLSLLGYALGGLATYILYLYFNKLEDKASESVDSFGTTLEEE